MRVPGTIVLAATLLGGVGSLASPAPVQAAWLTAGYSTADEDLMLSLINGARTSAGLKPVVMDSRLRSIAQSRSSDFVQDRYFGHNIPTTCGQVFSILQQQGIAYSMAAENIGWNTYGDTSATQWQFDWFMGSSAHRANILNSRFTAIGVGAYKDAWTYGSACGQSGTGASYPAVRLYTIVFIEAAAADTTPPTVTAPVSKLYAASAGTATIPVRTSWTRTDPSGIAGSTLERSVNAGAYAGVSLSSSLAISVDQTLYDGSTYRYRVRATDTKGNGCANIYGATYKPSRVEQSSTSVAYGGSWASSANTSTSGGSYKYASAAGAWASFTFTGTSVGWLALKTTSGGTADVYIDGVLKGTISNYATSTTYRPIVYAYNWTTQGTHTIKIVAKGTGRIYLDGFVRLTI